jgi:outer membrane protein insertion porin family
MRRDAHLGRPHTFALAARLLAAVVGLCAAPAAAEEATWAPSGDGPRVVRVEIRGSTSLTEEALIRELSTRVGSVYDPAALENDLRRLWKSGRYRIAPRWEREPVEGGVALTLFLEERPVLRKIEFVGNKKIDTEKLRSEVEKAGLFAGRTARYDEAVAHRAMIALRTLYRSQTHFLAEIRYRAEAYEGVNERGVASVKLTFHIQENQGARVRGMRIVGNRAFTDADIERVIRFVLGNRAEGGGSDDFDYLHFVRALGQVQQGLYRDSGYLDASVELARLELFTWQRGEGKSRQWLVPHIEITEGPLYRIGEVGLTLKAPKEGPPLEVTREELVDILADPTPEFKDHKPARSGSVYSDTVKRQAVERLERALGQYGRVDTKVNARDVFGEEGARIDLDFVVRPSRPYRVRSVRVVGNHKTKPGVFTRELYHAGIRGEVRDRETGAVKREPSLLDSRKLDLAEKNIYYTGLVKSEFDEKTGMPRHGVKITPFPLEDGLADLRIEVNEAETGQLMMGFSVSSNGELAGQIEFKQGNFDVFGLPRSWDDWTNAFMGAGQSFELSAYFGMLNSVYRMNFVEPYFLGLPLKFQLGLFSTSSKRESYDESRDGASSEIGRVWSLHPFKRRKLRASVRWRNEFIGIDPDENPPSFVAQEGGTKRVTRAGVGLTFDSLDHFLRATEGVRLEISRDAAGGYLGGDKSFTTAEFDFRAHSRIGNGYRGNPQVVNFRFRTNHADPYYGDVTVPFYERFYAGGIGTIRGFEYRSVGPHEAPPPDRGDPLGGNFRMLATLEYTFPLESTNSIRGVVFADAGNVWSDPSDFDIDDVKKSAGVGIEIMPQGLPFPISMYWGYIIDRKDEDERQVFSFMFGNMFFF